MVEYHIGKFTRLCLHTHARTHTRSLSSWPISSQKAGLYRSWTDNHFTVPC